MRVAFSLLDFTIKCYLLDELSLNIFLLMTLIMEKEIIV